MKKLLTLLLCLYMVPAVSQTFSEVKATRVIAGNVLKPGMDTIMLNARDSGTIAYKNGALYIWRGSYWASNGGTVYTASNGVTLSGSNFKLGGSLVENTTISPAGSSFTFDDDIKIGTFLFGKGGGNVTSNMIVTQRDLTAMTTAAFNVGFGDGFYALSTGLRNSYLGHSALFNVSTGSWNTAGGFYAQYWNSTGSSNTSLGAYASTNIRIGGSNVHIGYNAGYNVGSVLGAASGQVMIGNEAGKNDTTSNKLYIDNSSTATPLIGGDFANDTLRVNGKLSILADSTGTAQNTLYMDQAGRIKKAAAPTIPVPDTVVYNTDQWRKAIKFLGGTHAVTMPVGYTSPLQVTTMVGLPDNAIRGIPFYIEKQTVITGVNWYVGQDGAYNADQTNGLALYTFDTATAIYTKVAETANDSAMWKRGTGKQTQAFTASYTALPGKILWLAPLYNAAVQVTQPQLRSAAPPMLDMLSVQTTRRLWWQLSTQNSFAATYTFAAATSAITNAGVYFELY